MGRIETRVQRDAKIESPAGVIDGGEDPHGVGGGPTFRNLLFWWAMLGSNQRPLPCEGSALPLS